MSVASFHRLTAAQPNLSHDPHRHHAHAFEAIAATLPLDSVGYEPAKREGRSSVWIEAHVADKLSALRGPLATHRSITGRVRRKMSRGATITATPITPPKTASASGQAENSSKSVSSLLYAGDARRWPARHGCPLGYSSPRCSRRRWRSRPMNHPITNAANRNAMITPMLANT